MSTRARLALLLFAASLAHADSVKLRNGATVRTPSLEYANGQLVPAKGAPIPRDAIREILLEAEQPKDAAPAATHVPKDVQNVLALARAQQAKYPDAAGILLEDDGTFTLNKDGVNSYRYKFRGLVLKDAKKSEWGQVGLYVEDRRERAKLLWARTIQPDGRVVEVDPAAARLAPIPGRTGHFSRGKVLSWSMPQVDVGSIVEYCYEKTEFDPFDPNMFFPGYFFQGRDPVTHSKMTVVMPSDKPLYWQARHMPPGAAEPRVARGKDTTSYVWEASNMAPLIPEPRMPPETSVLASVQCSPFKTWDYLYDWMQRFQTRRMVVTPEIEQTVAAVCAGAKDTEDKVARLYHYVQQQIRYISIKGSIGSGWSGHPAAFTLKNKYGDCIDKAILFATLMKAIGVESEPVIVLTNDAGVDDRTLPTMRGNHAISQVHLNARSFYLDSTSSVHRYPAFSRGDHGVTAVNALRREIGFIAVPPPEMNCRTYDMAMTVAANGDAEVHYRSRYVGDYEAGVRAYYTYTPPNNHARALSNMLSAMSPKARLKRHQLHNVPDISKPFSIEMWYGMPDHVVNAGDLRIFAMPGIEMEFGEVSLPTRTFDIVYRTSLETVKRITVRVPPTYKLKYLPAKVDLRTPYASYHAQYELQGASTIVFTSTFRRPKRIVPVKDYRLYREFLQQVSRSSKEQVFFEVEAP